MKIKSELHNLIESKVAKEELEILESIQDRVLWLSTRIVDYANNERSNVDGLKVGGHQASSASLVSVLTALYFDYLNSEGRMSI